MASTRPYYVHPLVAAAAVSVTLVSLVGVARFTGVLPGMAAIAVAVPAVVAVLPDSSPPTLLGLTVSLTPAIAPESASSTINREMRHGAGPSVFVHVLDEAARQRMARLAPALKRNGIALAGIKVVPAAPARSDLRYFRQTEKAEALKVQAALVALGLPAQRLKRIDGMGLVAKRRQYELWLSEG